MIQLSLLAERLTVQLKSIISSVLLALSTALYVGLCARADDGDLMVGDKGKAVVAFVDRMHQSLGFSGVVLAACDGQIIATVARGWTDDTHASRLTASSLFEIASCTKTFTAIAISQLAEQGKLSLNDSIANHLPNVPANCKSITIGHLLSHTSGIPGTNTNGMGEDVGKVVQTFLAGGPKQVPGTKFQYWNQGYALLSEIVASASGKSYVQYVHENILDRCNMPSSRFTGETAPKDASVAIGKSSMGGPRSALEHPYGSYGMQYRGMGGLVTNVEELWKWDRAIRNNELIKPESWRSMTTAGPGGYGLGLYVQNDPSGKTSQRHGGKVRGFQSEFRLYDSIDGAIFVLSNRDDSLANSLITHGIEQILFGKQVTELQLPKVPNETLIERVVGAYQDEKNRKLVIASDGGLPTLKIYWGGPVTSGFLGMDETGVPQLYMAVPSGGTLQFKADGPLEFSEETDKANSVSLLSLKPILTFRRSKP